MNDPTKITRNNRMAIVLLLDRSGSMSEDTIFFGKQMKKANALAIAVNTFIDELINRSRREEGIRDYFDIAALEYCGDGINSLLSPRGDFITPSRLAIQKVQTVNVEVERTLSSGQSILSTIISHAYVEPKSVGSTPMGAALEQAYRIVSRWAQAPANRDSIPPCIFNITDGEASDADPRAIRLCTDKIKDVTTNQGATILFNIHLSSRPEQSVLFPSSLNELPDERYARLLFECASTLPEAFNEHLPLIRPSIKLPAKAMSHNCSMEDILSILQIGTISAVNIR